MAPNQAKPNTRKLGRQPSPQKDQGKPQGIKKERQQLPSRKSARLNQAVSIHRNTEPKQLHSFPASNTPGKDFPQAKDQNKKRKRSQDNENSIPTIIPSQKRPRKSPPQSAIEYTLDQNTAIFEKEINPLEYWRNKFRWPKKFFEPESNMNPLLMKKRSSLYLRDEQSGVKSATSSSATPSGQQSREVKSTPYARLSYEDILATMGSFMDNSELDITATTKNLCRILLEKEQPLPQDSLFRDDIFNKACRKIQAKNEARIVQDITRLIVPSAETQAIYGATHLDNLIESVNEGWNSAIPFYGPRPQPDYSVGFGRSAFTDNQLEILKPFVGGVTDTFTSYFMATRQMYFPFLTCEVKCSIAALDIADRQNAHSMTIAVRGIVELFKLMKREDELHREILAFSISHDHRTVRIYGHYPVIDKEKIRFYRHPIHEFSFRALGGKDKWTAYKFTKNVYDIWMPTHLKRICSILDMLPHNLNFELSIRSEPRDLSHQFSSQSSYNSASLLTEVDSQLSCVSSQDATLKEVLSQSINGRVTKKPKKRTRLEELHQSHDDV